MRLEKNSSGSWKSAGIWGEGVTELMESFPSFSFHLFWKRTFWDKCRRFLLAGCLSCVKKILKETQNTDRDQWPGIILSSSTNSAFYPQWDGK